ncbi:MAG: bifunctional serine/threonine-protein kinase/formylglycine-generating enzyme family protein [Planctomycetota bacterium]
MARGTYNERLVWPSTSAGNKEGAGVWMDNFSDAGIVDTIVVGNQPEGIPVRGTATVWTAYNAPTSMTTEPGEPAPQDSDLVEAAVGRALERYFEDGERAIEEACEAHPALADEIRRAFLRLVDSGMLTIQQIGPFRLLRELGKGGMGAVYLAEQREPVRRRVALKVIKLGMDTERVLARFAAERQALALMNHDHIARVYEAGTTPRGQPYFVLEYVPGVPINEHCDQHRLPASERLGLFQKVCEAVQHAHQRGVIHRDLKPGNILVSVQQGRAVPKVIDFGLARATDHRLVAQTLHTEEGRWVGTPEYMSPEQAQMSSQDIDTRTDIYSLGVVLYLLLTGDLPIPADVMRQGTPEDVPRRIRDHAPRRPSSAVAAVDTDVAKQLAAERRTTPRAMVRDLRGDLDWIVMKAVDPDRNRRYPTASEFAADVQRYLDHEPVSAGPPTFTYRARKLIERHRRQFAAAVAVFVALLGGLLASLWFYADAQAAQHRAEQALQEFDQLAYVVKLGDAEAAEPELYRDWPRHAEALRAWLRKRGEPLAGAIPRLRAALRGMRERAGATEAKPRFGSSSQQFLYDALADLVRRLEEFAADGATLDRVRRELAWVEQVEEQTLTRHRAAWAEARAAIAKSDGVVASAAYAGLDLPEQVGLIPIGMDPGSRLWEFYHPRSGTLETPPTRAPATGQLPEVTRASGMVFVLIPPATFLMGCQAREPDAPNYDAAALPADGPPVEVTLDAFFIAKHEMTAGQWLALSNGERPNEYVPGKEVRGRDVVQKLRWTNPVESVSWDQCVALLRRHGLTLPTEARWEVAARGGSSTPWPSGADPRALDGAANLGDRAAASAGLPAQLDWLDDGFIVHGPVDALRPNGFGLHHVIGNVFEWCLDAEAGYEQAPRRGDGLRVSDSPRRVLRGGSFYDDVDRARVGARGFEVADGHGHNLGLRVARPVLR